MNQPIKITNTFASSLLLADLISDLLGTVVGLVPDLLTIVTDLLNNLLGNGITLPGVPQAGFDGVVPALLGVIQSVLDALGPAYKATVCEIEAMIAILLSVLDQVTAAITKALAAITARVTAILTADPTNVAGATAAATEEIAKLTSILTPLGDLVGFLAAIDPNGGSTPDQVRQQFVKSVGTVNSVLVVSSLMFCF